VPNRPDTRFVIASVTKPITAVATLALVERGELHLDDTVADLLPWYRSDTGSRVTIHHLLSHTSGLPNFAGREFWEGPAPRLDYDRREFLEEFGSGDLLFEPGSAARYSDTNYILLATILEQVTGTTFGEVLSQYVFGPAGMSDSGVAESGAILGGVASGYVERHGKVSAGPFINYADVQRGAGDVVSTAADLFRFVRSVRSGRVLGPELREALFAPCADSGFPGQRQGYGWNLGTLETSDGRGIPFAQAPGNNGGFNALLYVLPESDAVVAVLLNTGTPWLDARLFTIAEALARILYGEPVPTPRPSVVPVLRRIRDASGGDGLGAAYRVLVASSAFDPDESGVNRLGYELLQAGDSARAIEVFGAVAELFPDSWNAQDSLGEAYWNAHRYEESLARYRRSVELNPENRNGRQRIELLESGEPLPPQAQAR
jgi:CubicO group peptidase (beta-lactamase class C family)